MSKLGYFSKSCIDIVELEEVYGLHLMESPKDRPFIWTNSVLSLDGLLSLLEKGQQGATEITLKNITPDAESDWRALQYGWATADAILISWLCLNREQITTLDLVYDDLKKYRTEVLKKSPQPLKVVLTTSFF